jgi:hypothetical protein
VLLGLPIIDVALGMVFIYLLLSLIATPLVEMWEHLRQRRADLLEEGLEKILGADAKEKILDHELIGSRRMLKDGKIDPTSVWYKLGFHPVRPAYIRPDILGVVLLDLREKGALSGSAAGFADAIRRVARFDDAAFRRLAGDALDEALQLQSGRYRQISQVRLLVVGLLIAVALNVNSIDLARTLWQNADLAREIAALAGEHSQPLRLLIEGRPGGGAVGGDAAGTAITGQQVLDALRKFPIGWPSPGANEDWWTAICGALAWSMFPGFALTALAVSLGAQFWFNALQNLLRLRQSDPKPDGERQRRGGAG